MACHLAAVYRRVLCRPRRRQDESDPGPVEVLGVLPDRYILDVGLRGWRHQCGLVGSLGWLRITVAALAARSADTPEAVGMLWIVDAPGRGVIVAARSAAAARAVVWQAGPTACASDEESRRHGDVIIVADAVSPAEEERLERLAGQDATRRP